MNKALADKIKANRKEYRRLLKDSDYFDVRFNEKNGGLMATHKEHRFDPKRGGYEENVQKIGFENGYAVILEKEFMNQYKVKQTEGTWNGKLFEIAAAEVGTSNNIKKGLNHCAGKPSIKIAIIYFPNDNFNIPTFENAFARYTGVGELGGKGYVKFDEIICIGKDKILYKKKAT